MHRRVHSASKQVPLRRSSQQTTNTPDLPTWNVGHGSAGRHGEVVGVRVCWRRAFLDRDVPRLWWCRARCRRRQTQQRGRLSRLGIAPHQPPIHCSVSYLMLRWRRWWNGMEWKEQQRRGRRTERHGRCVTSYSLASSSRAQESPSGPERPTVP
jgi:hypothetical protein